MKEILLSRTRVTKREKMSRDLEIQKRLIEGWTQAEIVRRYSELWSCSDVNVRKYVKAVVDGWRDSLLEERHTLRNKFLDRLETLFRDCYAAGNYKTALDVQKEIHRICGLHDEQREDGSLAPVITISPRRAAANDHLAIAASEGSTDAESDEES